MWRILIAVPISWIAGLATYVMALRWFWDQTMGGDAIAVMLWSFIALLIAVPMAYWPTLTFLSRVLHGYRPRALFVLTAVALGIIPTAMIVLLWGGGLSGLLSPEAQLFYCMFAAVGLVLGLAFSLRRNPTV